MKPPPRHSTETRKPQLAALDRGTTGLVAQIFDSIGFEVRDEGAYNLLAEYADREGRRSEVFRGDVTIHGRCWLLGSGLEVWSVIYESPTELYYADCRPAFRGRYARRVQTWEIAEYCEDGEAIVRATLVRGPEVFFELQNFTEVEPQSLRNPRLDIAIAGLAYSARIQQAAPGNRSRPGITRCFSQTTECQVDFAENEYSIEGMILSWREIANGTSKKPCIWLQVDAGRVCLEVVVSRHALQGTPCIGAAINAKVWLQGHILQTDEVLSRFEGVDSDSGRHDFWALLKKHN